MDGDLANSTPNDGFAVVTSLTSAPAYKQFDSYNDSNVASSQGGNCTGNCQPYLQLTYNADVAPQINSMFPPDNTNVTTLTPELLAIGADPDSWPNPSLEYDFIVDDSAGAQVATSGSIASNDWTVPASAGLSWGQTYSWTVQAYDGEDYSPDPQPDFFTTTVPQPLVTSQLSLNPAGPGFNPQTGNWTTSATDAQVPTVGPALEITRDYNSADPRLSGAFGAGWSSVLDMKVSAGEYNSAGGTDDAGGDLPRRGGRRVRPEPRRDDVLPAVGPVRHPGGGVRGRFHPDRQERHGVHAHAAARHRGVRRQLDHRRGRPDRDVRLHLERGHQHHLGVGPGTGHFLGDAVRGRVPARRLGGHRRRHPRERVDRAGLDLLLLRGRSGLGVPARLDDRLHRVRLHRRVGLPEAVLDSAPHSYWRLDETTGGTAVDSVLANEDGDNGYYTGGRSTRTRGRWRGRRRPRRPSTGPPTCRCPATW